LLESSQLSPRLTGGSEFLVWLAIGMTERVDMRFERAQHTQMLMRLQHRPRVKCPERNDVGLQALTGSVRQS
jgi:hypothetical protein